MTKEELIQSLYEQNIIDIWEAELLSAPDFVIGTLPMPKYEVNTTNGKYRLLAYQMN